ncbi:nuclear transport factor 2 family protein [Stappia sp. F7233]|uniref:Nuclear transport factor 2 family protein n=1 Tax=Stappia albiluteola TaxID=2758565 RepID=A0A839ACA2_9HYPH|nr:nuclear transport factor 2 family protein [Stappia albiluteola]MBA5777091.1 nuclear transport factor 2 family protein [Stappia albiluteola]
MKRILLPLTLAAMLLAPLILAPKGSAQANTADELRATYLAFVEAQNAHDPERIGAFFIDGPDFLWVSDGKSFWGRDAVLARMGSFQKAALWRVEPDLDKVRISEVTSQSAIFHVPLTLVIGSAEKPDRLRFLVSAVFVKQVSGWRIAALLTTTEKS